MIKKLLEALFRHKFVLFLPAVLIPAIVTPVAFLTTPPVYDVPAGIWIDHPVYLDYKESGKLYYFRTITSLTVKHGDGVHTGVCH